MMDLEHNGTRVSVHGIPGEGARARGICKAVVPLLASAFVFGLFTGVIIPAEAGNVAVFALAGIFVLTLWLAYDFYSGVSSYFKGARGEEIVAVWLAAGLPGGYHVFHDLERAGSVPIDHLVIGPTGIFVIETKFWSGRVTGRDGELLIDGERPTRSPINQVNAECHALAAFFTDKTGASPDIRAVLCFASGTYCGSGQPLTETVGGASICNVQDLCDLIVSGGTALTGSEVERLAKLMEI
jgi:hypothetical protein